MDKKTTKESNMVNNEFTVNSIDVRFKKINKDDYTSLTYLVRYANPAEPKVPIATWMCSKDVIAYLGLWEKLHNPDFKGHEFETFENAAGRHSFYLSRKNGLKVPVPLVSFQNRVTAVIYEHRDIALSLQVG